MPAADKAFEARLEEECQRVEDDQFVGLFIKNLENVQGDERDVIIMSVCYAPNANGRMLMNFGPINRRGGEKRLNVIFSRAKRHMAVVSSITANDIKNEHNEGANYLRRFLQYAERLSAGEQDGAATVLDSLSLRGAEHSSDQVAAVTLRIAERLQAQGHHVDRNVGSSYFRCDLAVRANDGKGYRLGILIDSDVHYRNDDVLEQYCQRPALLRAFGWEVISILAKDWFNDPEQVMAHVERVLAGEEEAAPEVVVEHLPLPDPKPIAVAPEALEPAPSVVESRPDPIASTNDASFERYECVEDGSSKFWEVKVEGAAYTVRYGRIGTTGQSLTKQFADEATARREMEKVRGTKVEKGYRRA